MADLRPARHVLDRAELPHDRGEGRESRDDTEHHEHPLVFVLWPLLHTRVPSRVRHHERDHDEERPGADIPGDEQARRFTDVEATGNKNRDH